MMDDSTILSFLPLTLIVIFLVYKAVSGEDPSEAPAREVRNRLLGDGLEPVSLEVKRLRSVVGEKWHVEFEARSRSGELIQGHAKCSEDTWSMHYPSEFVLEAENRDSEQELEW